MILTNLAYSEFKGTPQEWKLSDLILGQSNLVVGKNASGKSRTLNVINGLGTMVSGKQKPAYQSGDYDAHFEDGEKTIRYQLRYTDQKVIFEEFSENGKTLLARGDRGIGTIYHSKIENDLEFQTPESELAVVARRDAIQHAFLSPLSEWGEGVRHYAFGGRMGRETLAVLAKGGPQPDPAQANSAIGLFRKADKEYPGVFENAVISDMREIEYQLDHVGVRPPRNVVVQLPGVNPTALFVKESDLPGETEQTEMSQGMFRALAIIIHVNYAIFASKPSCVLIDDIGEGLDFERSCKLIDLVRRKVQQSSAQLVMATNDRFIMNKVPLEEWSVIQRNCGHVRLRNYANSKAIFDDFKYTGLSNFDFFATDYLEEAKEGEAVTRE